MRDTALETLLRRDRAIVVVALVTLTAVSWLYILWLASAMDTATATKRRICTETRAVENPGMTIRQAPIRQNAAKSASTVPSGSEIMKSSQ